ncbi:cytochrome o ubiquinol oxidase subunit IV [Buchnera aphidicola]|uniref:cytochrome o ubiquinol oxidase subunit IV n=1 Tax=Buchnera aphidicola TaxID=9 RepID=UPI0031B88190
MFNNYKKIRNMITVINSYILGCIFSIILTIIPFLLVKVQVLSNIILDIVISLCALVQIVIHCVYFLNLRIDNKNKWNIITIMFTVIVIFIIVSGSIWIMSNLTSNVMCY